MPEGSNQVSFEKIFFYVLFTVSVFFCKGGGGFPRPRGRGRDLPLCPFSHFFKGRGFANKDGSMGTSVARKPFFDKISFKAAMPNNGVMDGGEARDCHFF